MTEKFSSINDVSSDAHMFLSDMFKRAGLPVNSIRDYDTYIIGSTAVKMLRIQYPDVKQMVHEPRSLDIVFTSMKDYTSFCSCLKAFGYQKYTRSKPNWINTMQSSYFLRDVPGDVNVMLFLGNKITDILSKSSLSITQCAYSTKADIFIVGQHALLNDCYVYENWETDVNAFKRSMGYLMKYIEYGFNPVYPSIVNFNEDIHNFTITGNDDISRFIRAKYKFVSTSSGVQLVHKCISTTDPKINVTASTSDREVTTSDREVTTSDREVTTSDREVTTSDREVTTSGPRGDYV